MGMTIKDAIHHLHAWSTTHGSGQTTDEQHKEAKKVAIDTMRKYQKIEEAYSAYLETMNPETLADLISTII